jgi:hypothetical protein
MTWTHDRSGQEWAALTNGRTNSRPAGVLAQDKWTVSHSYTALIQWKAPGMMPRGRILCRCGLGHTIPCQFDLLRISS